MWDAKAIEFRCGGIWHTTSVTQLGIDLGIYTTEETDIDIWFEAKTTFTDEGDDDEAEAGNRISGSEPEKVAACTSFKEETNVVGELTEPEKKALDELKQLVQEALNKHEFSASLAPKSEPANQETPVLVPALEVVAECKQEHKDLSASVTEPEPEPLEKEVTEVIVKTESIDEDGAKKIEAIQETIVKSEQTTPPPCAAEESPVPPEQVSIWGIPLLADERSDVILLKFLRARDFKVKEAFTMLKSVVAWRKEFDIESLLEEDLGTDQGKVVYMHGVDKEGHPV
ncbi:patellin-1-like, partial [Bidens hawaiensis]|uniref:patellin-1-like n=1 Tax=Bidens hawaiensis TaxID=980011 RepID=UPI00404ABC87